MQKQMQMEKAGMIVRVGRIRFFSHSFTRTYCCRIGGMRTLRSAGDLRAYWMRFHFARIRTQ